MELQALGIRQLALSSDGVVFVDPPQGAQDVSALVREVAQQFHHPDFIPYPRSCYAEGPLNPYLNNEVF